MTLVGRKHDGLLVRRSHAGEKGEAALCLTDCWRKTTARRLDLGPSSAQSPNSSTNQYQRLIALLHEYPLHFYTANNSPETMLMVVSLSTTAEVPEQFRNG